MRKEAAHSPGPNHRTTNQVNDETLTAHAERHESQEGHMYSGHIYSQRPTHTFRRFTLGVVLAVLALTFVPSLVDQYAAAVPQQVVRESAAAPVLPDSAVQENATQAPAAFSDALAAAPAGAQCSVEAHSCSVPSADSEAALTSNNETAVAYGFTQAPRGASHNRM